MKINIQAIKIESQLKLYFFLKYPHLSVVSFPARKKYKFLTEKTVDSKYKRKKWVVEYVKSILKENLLEKFLQEKKK